MKSLLFLPMALGLAVSAKAQIFADFKTSLGDFTCELNAAAAPKAVANFIGLAQGSLPWLDETTGQVVAGKPYYNGLTFHRVIVNFMNQSGSRNGLGTDGPGYVFLDETENGLNHDSAGVLSMANSGANTNGSQFFVTAATASHLNGKHTVFGKVVSGLATVLAINQVPTSATSKPLVPVTINSVAIRRVGPAAEAFDIKAQNLPVFDKPRGRLQVQPGVSTSFLLDNPIPAGTIFHVYGGANLTAWSKLSELYQGSDSAGDSLIPLDEAKAPRAFYNLSLTTYPDAKFPHLTGGRTLNISWPLNAGGTATIRCEFNAAGDGGTLYYSGNPTPQPMTVDYYPEPYTATWIIATPDLAKLGILVDFSKDTSGTLSGGYELYTQGMWGWSFFQEGPFTYAVTPAGPQ
jgi:peptidyl-prolyl cis-trans isomerase A (cyclophilin A)